MRRMSAGSGYQYLLRSVAAGDGQRAMSTPLTRYYSEVGTPPGRWLGSGVGAFGAGQIRPGMQVTEEQLALLVGMGRDPVTGEQLGRAYPSYKRLADRIEERVAALDPEMTQEDCAAETTRIEAEETAAGMRRAVAGFDLTFSVPKSVSVLWGVADAVTQERIVAAHHAAVADVIDLFEREVAATRAGISDSDGAVAQVDVAGVAAVAYDHFDSRAGDPQLHTHVVIANKVLTVMDGRWRSLDGRPVFASRTGLSAHYDALLADRLSRDLGIEWELRQRGPDRNPRWEIAGVSDDLITEFSSRTREIELKKDELIAEYVARHGRMPSAKTIVELRAQATLATRPPKEVRSLADLTADWRQRAAERLGTEPSAWSRDADRPRREPADCRRRAAGCDRGDQRRRGRGGVCEAGGVDALEPDGRGVEADHGSEVRDDRGPRGCRRAGRRRGAVAVRGPDPAGARDSARSGSSGRTARAGSVRGTARSTPRPRSSRPRRACWLAPRR